jgi:small subunit ribosomal protein S4
MGRYTGPVCRLCRREGMKLMLKGTRCATNKCALERRQSVPGMHGFRRGKLTEYGLRLREKQKVKHFYGILERQFQRYFAEAERSKGNTGEVLMSLLERRLDNVVYRLGFALSRRHARQLVRHGHILVNGRRVDVPSYVVDVGDVITPRNRPKTLEMVKAAMEINTAPVPDYLSRVEGEIPEGHVLRLPTLEDVAIKVNPQLIIEFSSR